MVKNRNIAAATSTATSTQSKVKPYQYTLLKDLQPKSVSNVYGVVKFRRHPNKTRGTG